MHFNHQSINMDISNFFNNVSTMFENVKPVIAKLFNDITKKFTKEQEYSIFDYHPEYNPTTVVIAIITFSMIYAVGLIAYRYINYLSSNTSSSSLESINDNYTTTINDNIDSLILLCEKLEEQYSKLKSKYIKLTEKVNISDETLSQVNNTLTLLSYKVNKLEKDINILDRYINTVNQRIDVLEEDFDADDEEYEPTDSTTYLYNALMRCTIKELINIYGSDMILDEIKDKLHKNTYKEQLAYCCIKTILDEYEPTDESTEFVDYLIDFEYLPIKAVKYIIKYRDEVNSQNQYDTYNALFD